MSDNAQNVNIPIVETAEAFSGYANRLVGVEFDNHNYTVLFGHQRASLADNQARNHVVARITLTPAAVVELVNGLNNMVRTLNERAAAQQAAAGKA